MNHNHPDSGPTGYERAIARRIKNARHAKALAASEAAAALSQQATTLAIIQGGTMTTTPAEVAA